MHNRNTGESLSRPFPRLQRTRRCRGGTSHTDFKHRTSKCTPFPYRPASGLPPLLPAATPFSNAPTCRRRPPPYIHGYRDTLWTTSTPSVAPSLHVATISIFLQRGLSTAASANRRTQAKSSRRSATRASPRSRAATQSLHASNRKRLTTTRATGLLPPTVSTAASPAFFITSDSSPPSTQHTSQ
jgi:hypothetical protein